MTVMLAVGAKVGMKCPVGFICPVSSDSLRRRSLHTGERLQAEQSKDISDRDPAVRREFRLDFQSLFFRILLHTSF